MKKISVIVPVFNNEETILNCLQALINQNYPKEDFEILVVNDGSTDKTAQLIKKIQLKAKRKGFVLRIINLKHNEGRIIARETGAKQAKYNNLFFIDSRCLADENILNELIKINYQPLICNINIDYSRSYFDRFNYLFRKKIYVSHYGQNFKPVFITKNNFDSIPKGIGAFFCNKKLFLDSSLKDKSKTSSDDPKLLWNIVLRKKILKCPEIKITYLSRVSFKKTLQQIYNRGLIFVDFYLSFKKQRFWLFIVLPLLILMLTLYIVLFFRNFFFLWLTGALIAWVSLSLWLAENIKDFIISFLFLPLTGLSFELGILKGLLLKLCEKIK